MWNQTACDIASTIHISQVCGVGAQYQAAVKDDYIGEGCSAPAGYQPEEELCDAFARSGRSPCFHFEPLGLSRRTTKSCVAICSLLCSFLIPYVLLPFTCSPSGSRTFHDMHSHRTLFHLELYLHMPLSLPCLLYFHMFLCLLFSRRSWTFPVHMTPSRLLGV
jgi:hypothetical protein